MYDDPQLKEWGLWASTLYYIGVGVVLVGTGIRFLFRFFKRYNDNFDFIEDLRDEDLPYLKAAIQKIAAKLDIELEPGPKTPQED